MNSILVSYCCITNCCEIRLSEMDIYYPYSFCGFGTQEQPCWQYPLGITPQAETAVFWKLDQEKYTLSK